MSEVAKFGIGRYVVVRTQSAGVRCGVLLARSGREVIVGDSRIIWSWKDAYTLNEIASDGVGDKSRVSAPVDEELVTEAIAIVPCTDRAEKNLRGAKWSKE